MKTSPDADAVALDSLEEAGVKVKPGFTHGITMFQIRAVQACIEGGGVKPVDGVTREQRYDAEERLRNDLTWTLEEQQTLAEWEHSRWMAQRAKAPAVTAVVSAAGVQQQLTYRHTEHGDTEVIRPLSTMLLDGSGPPPFSPFDAHLNDCTRCGETPRPTDPLPSNGVCVFCGYWGIPPGPERESWRARRTTPNDLSRRP